MRSEEERSERRNWDSKIRKLGTECYICETYVNMLGYFNGLGEHGDGILANI